MPIYTATGTLIGSPGQLSAGVVTFVGAATATLVGKSGQLSAQATFSNACNFGISIVNDSAQAIYGITERFKINTCLSGVRHRHRNRVLHLGRAKPCMVTVTGTFASIYSGTHFRAGEFHFVHPSQIWEFTNLTAVSGLLPHESDSPAIPIAPLGQVDKDTVFSSFMGQLNYND